MWLTLLGSLRVLRDRGWLLALARNRRAIPRHSERRNVATLTINQRQVGPVTILDLHGDIGLGAASQMLRRTIRDLMEGGSTKIVLNFSRVDWMDSAGVGELAGAYLPMKTKGGEIKFLNPTKHVQRVLQLTQLDRVFEVHTDEQRAIGSFS